MLYSCKVIIIVITRINLGYPASENDYHLQNCQLFLHRVIQGGEQNDIYMCLSRIIARCREMGSSVETFNSECAPDRSVASEPASIISPLNFDVDQISRIFHQEMQVDSFSVQLGYTVMKRTFAL